MEDEPQDGRESRSVDRELLTRFMAEFRGLVDEIFKHADLELDKGTELNKQISGFSEKMLLLNVGTIGLSVSALISYASKFTLVGWHKYLIASLVAFGWMSLVLSSGLCGLIMAVCLASNRLLYKQWMASLSEYYGGGILSKIANLSQAFHGTFVVNGQTVEAKDLFNPLIESTRVRWQALVDEQRNGHTENLSTLKKVSTGETGASALRLTQIGMVSLGIAALTLLCGI